MDDPQGLPARIAIRSPYCSLYVGVFGGDRCKFSIVKFLNRFFPNTVILCGRNGDHCNRLFQSIHFHAFCLENDLCFWNPTLLGMLRQSGLISPRWGNICNTALRQISRVLQLFGINHCWQLEPTIRQRLQLVGGWSYRCNALTSRYRTTFQQVYRLRQKLNHAEADLLSSLQCAKASGAVVVGLHVRRGDYKDFKGGRYYFSNAVYAQIVTRLREYYAKRGSTCWVLVCSNDSDWPACGQNITSRGRWFADQMLLQECDLLIGPPSTFTLWASYIAEIPYLHVHSAEQALSFEDAMICDG